MGRFICLIFAEHQNNGKPYLFLIEPPVEIDRGAHIMVDTMYGPSEATAISKSFMVPNDAAKIMAQSVGAYFPLKKVLSIGVQMNLNECDSDLPF